MDLFEKGKNNKTTPNKEENLFLPHAKSMEDIVNYFLHEVTPSLMQAEYEIRNALRGRYKVDKRTRESLESIENIINKIKSIHVFLHESVAPKQISRDNFHSKEFCNLNSLAEIAVHMSKMKYGRRGLRFKTSYSSTCNVFCNKTGIVQAIIQILNNLIEACRSEIGEREICLSTKLFTDKSAQKYSIIEITNSREPIPEEINEIMFEPLVSTENHSLALGLSVAKENIEMNDGNIEVDSLANLENAICDKGSGVSFKITFKDQKRKYE